MRQPLTVAFCSLVFSANGLAFAADPPANAPTNEALRSELLAMRDADQQARDNARRAGGIDALLKVRQEVDVPNTRRMKEIVAKHGWPGKTLVGDDGAT